jgi:glycosyltransferase involved in cell wall biosynthesis
MKVLLLANYANDSQESMQRFALLMARGLMRAGHEVQNLRPPACIGQLHPSARGLGKWLGYVDKFGVFPPLLRAAVKSADVVHICDHSNSFYTKYMRSVPHIVTCHDLLAIRSALGEIPQKRTGWTGRRLQRLIVEGLTGAQHIACVSEATRRDLLRVIDIPESRVSRTYNSLNYPYSRMEAHKAESRVRQLGVDPSQLFFLHVGGNQWYKNRLGVLRIFAILARRMAGRSPKFVMVGKPWTVEMRRFVLEHGLTDATLELTGVAEEDLRALYSTAATMIFPSLQEGFGWPIIEAQACGCPVATSNRAPMNEIGGDAAIYIDPENPESAAVAVQCSLENSAGLRELSLANAARFKVSAMIDSYLSLYEKVCNETYVRNHGINPISRTGPYIDSRPPTSLAATLRRKELS